MLIGHSADVLFADFTDDSRRLLSGSKDGTVKIWDVTTGDSLATLRGHAGPVDWVGLRNDDSQIISLSRADGTVRIWNAATEEKIWQKPLNWVELARHHQQANRLAEAIAAYDRAVELAPNDPDLLILRGEAYATLDKWGEANDDWRRAMQLNESVLQASFDRIREAGKWQAAARLGMCLIEQEPEDHIRWLNVAPLLVMAEDEQGYREFCDAMVKQFSDTDDQTTAANTCTACLLLPDAVDLSKLPVKVFADPLDGTSHQSLRPRAWAARALVAYRSGDTDLAGKYLQEGWRSKPDAPTRALYHAIGALKRHGQGNSDGAREALGKVRQMLDQRLPNAKPSELHNWLIPQILADEAEGLLNDEGDSSEAERTNGSN